MGVDVGGTVRIDLGEIARGAEKYHGKSTVAFTEMVAVDDIDSKDHGDPQLCAEYAAEIYHYMRQLEVCDWAGRGGVPVLLEAHTHSLFSFGQFQLISSVCLLGHFVRRQAKGKPHSKIISSDLTDFFPGKIRC